MFTFFDFAAASHELDEALLVQDALFVFQGIDGRYIKFDPTSDAYLLDSAVGITQPVRDLCRYVCVHVCVCVCVVMMRDVERVCACHNGERERERERESDAYSHCHTRIINLVTASCVSWDGCSVACAGSFTSTRAIPRWGWSGR